ncbi:MAG: hypothetical protein AB2L13_08115 [Spirochaetota bacterium]
MAKYVLNLMLILAVGCATYRNFPVEKIGTPPGKKEYKLLYYKIENGTVFSGRERLGEIFKKESPFLNTEKVDEMPKNGLYVRVVIEQIIPSTPALLFGYVSLVTLTFTPVWSTKDGYDVRYEVYSNGNRLKSFTYEVRRKAFVWVLSLPFIWVNAFTYSEGEAFEATAYKFFDDATILFRDDRSPTTD